MSTRLYSLSWMMGLLLGPHTLVLIGNLAGAYQYLFFAWLALAAGLFWINARSARQAADASQAGDPNPVLTSLLIVSRTVCTLALSTVLLVTAGFVFNETFVYWFPNFAFAFVLLGVVLVVNLWGRDAALVLQVGATAIVLFGLVSLITLGLWGNPDPGGVGDSMAASFQPHDIAAALLLFTGFDLALNHPTRTHQGRQAGSVQGALMAIAFVMGLWALVSLLYVPAARLSDTFIPHLIAARNVQGEAGRMVMGAVVIAGSLTAVNALFRSLAGLLAGVAARRRREMGYQWLNKFERPGVWTAFLAAAVGLMMAVGMAGTDVIDLWVRAGFILWIFYYGGMNLFVLMANRRSSGRGDRPDWVLPAIGAAAMALGGGVLLFTDPNGGILPKLFLSLVLLTAMGVAARFLFTLRSVMSSNGKITDKDELMRP